MYEDTNASAKSGEVFSDSFLRIIEYIKKRRLIDFNSYRPCTIKRRLAYRLSKTGQADFESYYNFLLETPSELDSLIGVLTIKVSHFFRNPYAFEAIHEIVLPDLIKRAGDDIIRIWSAGCAMGEEPYSIAILLNELFGSDDSPHRSFILGTDLDSGAIETAAKGEYNEVAVQNVKKLFFNKYFKNEQGIYKLNTEIKSMVNFAVHDITSLKTPKEGVFGDYHLIVCRNVMIYFEKEICEKLFTFFNNVIPVNGYIMLGEAETVPKKFAHRFREAVPNTRIFKKIA